MTRGGFQAEVLDVQKIGQVSFKWEGDFEKLKTNFSELEKSIESRCRRHYPQHGKRGGGVKKIELINLSHAEPDCYQLKN